MSASTTSIKEIQESIIQKLSASSEDVCPEGSYNELKKLQCAVRGDFPLLCHMLVDELECLRSRFAKAHETIAEKQSMYEKMKEELELWKAGTYTAPLKKEFILEVECQPFEVGICEYKSSSPEEIPVKKASTSPSAKVSVPGDFSFMKDSHTKEMFRDAFDTITRLELWSWLESFEEEKSFLINDFPELRAISGAMRISHSGSSFGYTMNAMKLLAKYGWKFFVSCFSE